MYYALFLCLYMSNPNTQDTCMQVSPRNAVFSREDCDEFLRIRGYRDSTSETSEKHYLCKEASGSLVCSADLKCHR